MDTTEREDTNGLYFIVGGLVVLALIFAFIYIGNNNATIGSTVVQPTTQTDIVPVPVTPAPENHTTNYNFGTDNNPNTANPPANGQ